MNTLNLIAIAVAINVVSALINPPDITVQIDCSELGVTATWNKTEFTDGNVTKVEWNDPACVGFKENDAQVWAATNFSRCQSIISQTNDIIVHKNTARVYVSHEVGIIRRDSLYSFALECTMQRSVYTPVGARYTITEKRLFRDINKTSTADFNVGMDIYRDNTFREKLVNPTFASFDPVFIGIKKRYANELLKFVTQECFATPTTDQQGSKYTFYENRCPIDNSFRTLQLNSELHYFRVDAFKFSEFSDSVYIHCRLAVCKNDSTADSCMQAQNCGSRKRREVSLETDSIRERREVSDDGDADDEPIEEVVVMTQKCTFTKKLDFKLRSCKDKNCPSYSSCFDLNPPVCRCGQGYVFNPATDSCSNERTFVVTDLAFDMKFDTSYLDPYSTGFVKLATRIEKELVNRVRLVGEHTIAGMKVISARKGSVIVDVLVMYNSTATENDAYATFLKAVSKTDTGSVDNVDPLPMKPNMTKTIKKKKRSSPPSTPSPLTPPSIMGSYASSSASSPPLTLILCIAIPSAFAIIIVLYVIKEREKLCCRKKAIEA